MFFMKSNHVSIAKRAIEEYLKTGKIPQVDGVLSDNDEKDEVKGVFVSLKKNGRLRGCIGTIEGRFPLEKEIIMNAIASATEDPRFPPLKIEEINEIDISVDVLEKEEMVKEISELNPDVYGVIVEKGYKKGLLLPSLPGVDTPEEQIEIAKDKAGIIGEDFLLKKFKVTRYDGV